MCCRKNKTRILKDTMTLLRQMFAFTLRNIYPFVIPIRRFVINSETEIWQIFASQSRIVGWLKNGSKSRSRSDHVVVSSLTKRCKRIQRWMRSCYRTQNDALIVSFFVVKRPKLLKIVARNCSKTLLYIRNRTNPNLN